MGAGFRFRRERKRALAPHRTDRTDRTYSGGALAAKWDYSHAFSASTAYAVPALVR
jgi:hypothetical protein